jgi:hypothetical protein
MINFIYFVFIITNINHYISNITKIELQSKSIIKIFEYTIQLQNKMKGKPAQQRAELAQHKWSQYVVTIVFNYST